jgi:N-acetylmuramoyl-L-alanine amidase
MRRWCGSLLVVLALLGGLPGETAAERPAALELRSRAGALGRLPVVLVDDGASYVSAERLAALVKGSWRVTGSRGRLAVGKRWALFATGQRRVLLDGKALTLDAPPRAGEAGWLIPADFLDKGLGRLAAGLTVARSPARLPVTRARSDAGALADLRYRSYPTFTRVVVQATAEVPYALEVTRQDVRVRLRGLGVPRAQREEVGDGLVKAVTLDADAAGAVLRVALETPAGEVKHFALQDPPRVVVDLYRPREPLPREAAPGVAEPLRLILLDPGHGGHDPGAVGPTGLMEKDVVLDVGLRVARMVEEQQLGIKVALTRTTDTFVPLQGRTQLANRQRADLFVSIHANGHARSVSEGVETYFLSSEATDNDARRVAAIENGVVRLEAAAARQRFDALQSILWDLAQSEFQHESSFLAEVVQDTMTRSLRLVNRGVKQAGFYVLGGAAMPAILIEIGFLTNPREERKLATSEHREALARAIVGGLAEYKRRHDLRMRTAQAPAARPERAP